MRNQLSIEKQPKLMKMKFLMYWLIQLKKEKIITAALEV